MRTVVWITISLAVITVIIVLFVAKPRSVPVVQQRIVSLDKQLTREQYAPTSAYLEKLTTLGTSDLPAGEKLRLGQHLASWRLYRIVTETPFGSAECGESPQAALLATINTEDHFTQTVGDSYTLYLTRNTRQWTTSTAKTFATHQTVNCQPNAILPFWADEAHILWRRPCPEPKADQPDAIRCFQIATVVDQTFK
ncbi:MAG: hypothetical protein HY975_03110 [Candidatus Kerfeldbacteria bacterium]|nr:hypothetical protein [Candidatus Kerfeldbacteria bacterium]